MRARRVVRLASLLITLALAGCGGAHHASSGLPAPLKRRPAAAGCSTAIAGGPAVTGLRPVFVAAHGAPFGIAVTPNGRFAFVGETDGAVGVFSLAGGIPRFRRSIRVKGAAVGISLTADGRYLLVADGEDGADVIDVGRAEAGLPHAFLGDMSAPARNAGAGAIEVASSPDGRYAFVSVEYGGHIAVYDLPKALRDGFSASAFVGSIPAGAGPVGLAVSPDGRWLYSTSEAGASGHPDDGVLEVISLGIAEHDPARAVVATVNGHCSPVRVALSPDGRTVWVTARESDQLLAFSAARLRSDPARALEAAVRVGEAPVGLALLDGGRLILVGDSNRFSEPHAQADLTVVSAPRALGHQPAIVGTIRSGQFPREMAVDAAGRTLIVGNFISRSLEAIGLSELDSAGR